MTESILTQIQVNEAADALLVAGEKPSTARVRAFIGTGTPSEIEGLLDVWWEALGARLLAPVVEHWNPPTPVVRAATALWVEATVLARSDAEGFRIDQNLSKPRDDEPRDQG